MLSMKAKYALRALIMMSAQDKKLQARLIAEQADVPPKFLETILAELKQHGLVDSKRGIFGGYFLARRPEDIMVGDVVRLLDGSLAPLPCASVHHYVKCDDCENEDTCVIRKIMIDVRNAVSNVLDTQNLRDLIQLSPKHSQFIFW